MNSTLHRSQFMSKREELSVVIQCNSLFQQLICNSRFKNKQTNERTNKQTNNKSNKSNNNNNTHTPTHTHPPTPHTRCVAFYWLLWFCCCCFCCCFLVIYASSFISLIGDHSEKSYITSLRADDHCFLIPGQKRNNVVNQLFFARANICLMVNFYVIVEPWKLYLLWLE